MPAIALVIAAAKAGCFIVGSIVHEVNELVKRFGVDHDDTARASCLLIKEEQLGLQLQLQEAPKESRSRSNAVILYASRDVVLSSNSRALAILTNDDLALEAPFNVIEKCLLPIMKSFKFCAAWAWFRARFITLMQSALLFVITDMKMAMSSFIGSVSESVVEKKAVASLACLIQANSSRLMTQVIGILKEATHLLKSRYARSMSKLHVHGQIFPAGIRGKKECFDLVSDIISISGDNISANLGTCVQQYLAMVVACVKRAVTMLFGHSTRLFRSVRLHSLNVMVLVLLLCVSVFLIGWSIPMMMFEGCKHEKGCLQKPLILEAVSKVEAGAFSSIASQFLYLSDDISNALRLRESIGNFDNLQPVSMAAGTIDRQVDDLHQLGPAEFIPIQLQHLWAANDFSSTAMPDLQTGYLGDDNDVTAAVSLVDWNIIQSNSGYEFGSGTALALDSSLFMYVLELAPGEDHASRGIAAEHFDFDGYSSSVSTNADEAFGLSFKSEALQDQSFVELELGSSSSASGGVVSTTLMMITIAAGAPQELFTINSLSREFDGDTDPMPMHVDDRYSDSTAVQVHEAYKYNNIGLDLDLVMLFMSIEVSHCIQSETSPSICVLGDLSPDRFGTCHFALVVAKAKAFDYTASSTADADETLVFTSSFIAQAPQNQFSSESLGRSTHSRSASDGSTLSKQMIVAYLGASNEIYSIQSRDLDRSSAADAARTHPPLRLPAAATAGRTRAWASDSNSSSRPKRFSVAVPPSLRLGALDLEVEESRRLDFFHELRQLAWILLLIMAYRNSDGVAETEIPPLPNLDLEEVVVVEDEIIFADEENEADEALVRNTNAKSSRHEVVALRSELGRHWKSPSKRFKRRTRRSSRLRSRPKYFEPTWA